MEGGGGGRERRREGRSEGVRGGGGRSRVISSKGALAVVLPWSSILGTP